MRIPADLTFADLQLELARDGGLRFLPSPLGKLCLANGIDPERALASEDQSCKLIADWYLLHREGGGAPDLAAETVLRWLAALEARAVGSSAVSVKRSL